MFSTEWLSLWKAPLQVQCGARTEASEHCSMPGAPGSNAGAGDTPSMIGLSPACALVGAAWDPAVWTKALQALRP